MQGELLDFKRIVRYELQTPTVQVDLLILIKQNGIKQPRAKPSHRRNSYIFVQGFLPIPAGGHCGRLNDVRMAALTSRIEYHDRATMDLARRSDLHHSFPRRATELIQPSRL